MYRTAIKILIDWKNNPNRLPMIIKGARQVGKTWMMKEFGKRYFNNIAYINFDNDTKGDLKTLFDGDFSVERIVLGLSMASGIKIEPEKTLIILDEIQNVPRALQSLKYFAEEQENKKEKYCIVAAGSLLGIALHQGTSFPVGKVDSMTLYPMTFIEFLNALDKKDFIDLLNRNDFQMIASFKSKYIEFLKLYYFIGGMPAAVAKYISTKNLNSVRETQLKLLSDYAQDFSKHAPNEVVPRINMVWNGIIAQLAKENKKFVYGVLKKGARAKDFEIAIQWLIDCGLCYKIDRINKGNVPLNAYLDFSSFKLYMLDVGLIGAMAQIDEKTVLQGNDIFTEFKGALTEQYVCQQLISCLNKKPFYWSAENSSGEIDFIIQHNGKVIPLEVKAEENLNAKSLKFFVEKYELGYGVRCSMSNFRKEEKIINIPLYCVSQLLDICEDKI
ncbi:MAG: ATP-binding protein [Elusimicrobia bacterium]|nr:ATP-binding protein [Elusimicrobiota bacterium]